MNLNNIVSYKKRGKINKNAISNLQNDQKSPENNNLILNRQRHETINHQFSNNSQNKFQSYPNQSKRARRVSFKSIQNNDDEQELITMLKEKFSDDFEQKINKFVVNNKFKTQNLNMNININYNPSKSSRKNSIKQKKQLSMYLKKKNKSNNSKQPNYSQKINNSIYQSQQKDNYNNQKTISFKDTFGLQNPFSTINEENQNFFIKDSKRKSLIKHKTLMQKDKLKTYKQIYSSKLSNQKNVKVLKNKQQKSLNLRGYQQNINQSSSKFHSLRYDNPQFIDSSQKIKLLKSQNVTTQHNLRYKTLDSKSIKPRYGSSDHESFKSSTIQLRRSVNYYQKSKTEQMVKNKNSQETLKKESFRKNFSKGRRILTQESKQIRQKIYLSINKKKDQQTSFSQQKLKLIKEQTQNTDRVSNHFEDSLIMSYIKKIGLEKIKTNQELKSSQKRKQKTFQRHEYILRNDNNSKRLLQNSNEIEIQNDLINLLQTKHKSQQNINQIIQKSLSIYHQLKNKPECVFLRKFVATIYIFFTFKIIFKEMIVLSTNRTLESNHQKVFKQTFICQNFQQILDFLCNLRSQKTKKQYVLPHLIIILIEQIEDFQILIKSLSKNVQNTSANDLTFQGKIKIYKQILENCGQKIYYFEGIQEKLNKKDRKSNLQFFQPRIIQSFKIELKLIELFFCKKILILRSSGLQLEKWDQFHLDGQNIYQMEFFIKKFEELQGLLKRNSERNMLKKDENKDFQNSLQNQIIKNIQLAFQKPQNQQSQTLDLIILTNFNFKDLYLPQLIDSDSNLNKNQKSNLNQFYSNLKEAFISGQYVLLRAYNLFQKHQYHQCQMFIQQSINQCRKPYLQKLLCLNLMIKINNKSFYDAQSQIQRLSYYGVFLEQKGEAQSNRLLNKSLKVSNQNRKIAQKQKTYLYQLRCFQRFISGVMFLIKRKTQDGLLCLIKTYQLIREASCSQFDGEIIPSFLIFIESIIEGYIGYSYYCLKKLDQAQKSFQKQIFVLSSSGNNESNGLLSMVNYNYLLCKGLKKLKEMNYNSAIQLFQRSLVILNRPQPHVYLAITYLRMGNFTNNQQNSMGNSLESQQYQIYEQGLYDHLNIACKLVAGMNNNFASQILYFRSLYDCWKGYWDLALIDIDDAIEKSQQNYPKHFYLRALILACGQNYAQAINEASIVISLDQKYYDAYLLRSKCSQIQANQNQAFIDLQTYIALRPQDTDIHKYAGHLLFENGAFEDAILAYQQGQSKNLDNSRIEESDFQVYLTKSKTYFLLGQFDQAADQMKIASKIRNNQYEYEFDYQMIKYLSDLIKLFQHYQSQSQVNIRNQNNPNSDQENFNKLLQQKLAQVQDIYRGKKQDKKYESVQGKIFKNVEYYLLRFLISFYLKNYSQSIIEGKKCIKVKQISFQLQNSDKSNQEFQEQENQKQLFISQMHYNLSLVYLKLQAYEQAEQELLQCQTSRTSKSYLEWKHLLSHVVKKQNFCRQIQCKQIPQINVYSDKNKLSKYFPYVTFLFKHDQSDNQVQKRMKLCIPYPKVQPPQISPSFDLTLLTGFSEDNIEKKPQAPWITNQKNCIKFTEQIKTFSRLDINDSQNGSKLKKPLGSKNKNQSSITSNSQSQLYDQSFNENHFIKKRSSKFSHNFKKQPAKNKNNESIILNNKKDLYEMLKLDAGVEMKLKKLVH